MAMLILTEKFIINSDFTTILQIMRVKITIENVDKIFLKMTDQSHLVKIVLIMHYEQRIKILNVHNCYPSHAILYKLVQTDGCPASSLYMENIELCHLAYMVPYHNCNGQNN